MAMKTVVALMGFNDRVRPEDPKSLLEREKGEKFEIDDKDVRYATYKHSGRIADVPAAAPAKAPAK